MDIFTVYQKDDMPFVRISAPMVRYSKLPFRLLLREHKLDLVYTPMIMADSFNKSQLARDAEFTTCAADRPLIVQLASNDPYEFSHATAMLLPYSDGVDLNCGCPQKWANEAGLGSALLKYPEKIAEIIRAARNVAPRWRNASSVQDDNYSSAVIYGNDNNNDNDNNNNEVNPVRRNEGPFSVTAKLRIPPTSDRATGNITSKLEVTVELVRRLAAMGVDWITLHARTQEQRTREPAMWDIVKELVDRNIKHTHMGTNLPIVLNGDVRSLDDAYKAHSSTGCHGVMVARALLRYPTLFNEKHPKNLVGFKQIIDRWFELSTAYGRGNCFHNMHQQTYWFSEPYLDKTRRMILHSTGSFSGMVDHFGEYWTSVGL